MTSILKNILNNELDEASETNWIKLDGDVGPEEASDTNWIKLDGDVGPEEAENLNSVLDNNNNHICLSDIKG